jgi:hypothetical protein
VSNIKQLEGWVSASDAAETLGLTRQGMNYRIKEGTIPSDAVRVIGTGGKNQYLISEEYLRGVQPRHDNEEAQGA